MAKKAAKPSEKKKGEAPGEKETLLDNIAAILVAVLFALFVRTFAVQAFQIPTSSMEDGLLIGDHLLVNKTVFGMDPGMKLPFLPRREIRRFDVIVFKYPGDPSQDYIKRVIGLPGDEVRIVDDVVYVNGKAVPENRALPQKPAAPDAGYYVETREGAGRYTVYLKGGRGPGLQGPSLWGPRPVPEGHFLVLGDNRDLSADSRVWGFVPREYVKGRALLVYWSFEAERDSHVWRGWGHLAWQWWDRIVHFVGKTRWSRTFRLVH